MESQLESERDCEQIAAVDCWSSWCVAKSKEKRNELGRGKPDKTDTGLFSCQDSASDMHSSETITKRLLISGLTPAISSDDLARRLGSFGSVTAMDGLGKLDALGQPRNFAHVTLETTKTQLSKCTPPLPALPFFLIYFHQA